MRRKRISPQQSQTHKKSNSKEQRKLKATTCPSLIHSTCIPPLFAVSVFRAAPIVIVVAISVVLLLIPVVDFGPDFGKGEGMALKVVATEYEAGKVARTSPMPAQNPSSELIVAYALGAAVCAYTSHVATALSKALGHQELVLT